MIFYHYTCIEHIEKILEDGFLKPSESNVSPSEEHVGPDVVWLLKKPLTGQVPQMLTGAIQKAGRSFGVDKSRICITIDLPSHEVQRADKFWKKHKVEQWWVDRLSGLGGKSKVKDWYVIPRNVPSSEWIEIGDRYNQNQKIQAGQT
jgi:hypothetical protein